ncbi:MAG: hypothetical protein COA75_08660 [Cellvibrionales bacterium]|nr:MAG: hypothetical protein COA75_08660 [Cellvibrionales bacterium]
MDIITMMKDYIKLALMIIPLVAASTVMGGSIKETKSQYDMGLKYLTGQEVIKNVEHGFQLVKQASDKGFSEAQYLLANLYLNGTGVDKSKEKSFELLNKAADQNNVSALLFLGRVYGSGAGGYEIVVDNSKAFQFYRRAALQGDAYAQSKVGFLFAYGKGVKQDKSMAAKWYTKAAEQGDANAQYNIGVAYQYGTGIAKNETLAREWFELAAKQGNRMAIKELKDLE